MNLAEHQEGRRPLSWGAPFSARLTRNSCSVHECEKTLKNEEKKHVFRNLLVKELDMLSAYVLT